MISKLLMVNELKNVLIGFSNGTVINFSLATGEWLYKIAENLELSPLIDLQFNPNERHMISALFENNKCVIHNLNTKENYDLPLGQDFTAKSCNFVTYHQKKQNLL